MPGGLSSSNRLCSQGREAAAISKPQDGRRRGLPGGVRGAHSCLRRSAREAQIEFLELLHEQAQSSPSNFAEIHAAPQRMWPRLVKNDDHRWGGPRRKLAARWFSRNSICYTSKVNRRRVIFADHAAARRGNGVRCAHCGRVFSGDSQAQVWAEVMACASSHQHKSYRHAPELKPSDEFARI
jgi:hypothetical protein